MLVILFIIEIPLNRGSLSGTPFWFFFFILSKFFMFLTCLLSHTVRHFVSVLPEDKDCCSVMTPILVQCHCCKQSHGSVLADLTTTALPVGKKKKKSGIVSWPVSRPHLACLLDTIANQPDSDILHMACNLFCYYRPPPTSDSTSNSFVTALCSCSFVSQLFIISPHTLRDCRSLQCTFFFSF